MAYTPSCFICSSLVSLMDAFEKSGITEVELDKEKMLLVLSLFILSGKTEIIEPISVVEKLVQIFNKIIIDEDYKVSSSSNFRLNAFHIYCYLTVEETCVQLLETKWCLSMKCFPLESYISVEDNSLVCEGRCIEISSCWNCSFSQFKVITYSPICK